MKRIVLTHRLETIALLCDGARVAADIGCDHGRLSCALIKQYGVKKVLASDISEISVQKTRTLAAKCGIGENELTAVRRDGLIGLSCGDADTLVISGMGGELIADIIDRNKPLALSCERIIMQPQRGVEELRAYLRANGFAIYDERVIYDGGRYYQILCAAKGKEKVVLDYYPNDFLLVGQMAAVNSPDMLMRYLRHRLHGTKKRLVSANSQKNPPTELIRQAQEIENVISILEERL